MPKLPVEVADKPMRELVAERAKVSAEKVRVEKMLAERQQELDALIKCGDALDEKLIARAGDIKLRVDLCQSKIRQLTDFLVELDGRVPKVFDRCRQSLFESVHAAVVEAALVAEKGLAPLFSDPLVRADLAGKSDRVTLLSYQSPAGIHMRLDSDPWLETQLLFDRIDSFRALFA